MTSDKPELERPSAGGTRRVRLLGRRDDPLAYGIRDFLKRSVVAFEWVELTDGERLFAPSLKEVADHLGFVARPSLREYDVSIYGAGPAGLSAAVYAASEGLRTILIERGAVGGLAGTTSMIENYLGFPDGMAGADLAERARQQALKFGVEIVMMSEGVKAEFRDCHIWVDLADGGQMVARANICATGVDWKRLGLPGEDGMLGRGIYYGAGASEAPLCKDEDVVGGGNSPGQAVMHLADHARQVVMLVRDAALAASMSRYLIVRLEQIPNVELRYDSEITALKGDERLARIEITGRDGEPE